MYERAELVEPVSASQDEGATQQQCSDVDEHERFDQSHARNGGRPGSPSQSLPKANKSREPNEDECTPEVMQMRLHVVETLESLPIEGSSAAAVCLSCLAECRCVRSRKHPKRQPRHRRFRHVNRQLMRLSLPGRVGAITGGIAGSDGITDSMASAREMSNGVPVVGASNPPHHHGTSRRLAHSREIVRRRLVTFRCSA